MWVHETYFWNFGTPLISRWQLMLETSNLTQIWMGVSNNEKSKIRSKGVMWSHVIHFWNFATLYLRNDWHRARWQFVLTTSFKLTVFDGYKRIPVKHRKLKFYLECHIHLCRDKYSTLKQWLLAISFACTQSHSAQFNDVIITANQSRQF